MITPFSSFLLRWTAALSIVLLLGACASRPAVERPRAQVRSVALIPATDPAEFTVQNLTSAVILAPVGGLLDLDNGRKTAMFNEKLSPARARLATGMTESIAQTLRDAGYEVRVLRDVARDPESPDRVDYEQVKTSTDAVLHVWLSEVGLYSGRFSPNYRPRVNAGGYLYLSGAENDGLYNEVVYYGVDAREGKSWAVIADERFAYSSFNEVMGRIEEVGQVFETGMRAVSQRMSEQILARIQRPR